MPRKVVWVFGLEASHWERLVDSLVKQKLLRTPQVIRALQAIPRGQFLPDDLQKHEATDTPLSIGSGQTISAPHMVAIMDEALDLKTGHKVLEVGAGSGWHAATVAHIIAPPAAPRSEWGHVYTVEIVTSLAKNARRNIREAGYGDRITIISGDGSLGYKQKAPFDRILVTAAAPRIPEPLLDQLKPHGILVAPVGKLSLFQYLMKITKLPDGKTAEENLGGVAFVPLTGKFGHKL
ncbi:MAG: protein-L-isoaspartate(D-aspartate) O-methyltransferase [Candidatus Bathyarchaeota archaeon]|nr:protein-L-isoaspartate(D-aspartate) O-methyltransferase [Candidatus Bathyarchaeota archaeon]